MYVDIRFSCLYCVNCIFFGKYNIWYKMVLYKGILDNYVLVCVLLNLNVKVFFLSIFLFLRKIYIIY